MKRLPEDQVLLRISSENPWWKETKVKQYTGLTPRPYLELLYPLITEREIKRAVVLLGPRRVGKTVIIHHAIEKLIQNKVDPHSICYISVDHPVYNGLGIDDLLQKYQKTTDFNFSEKECYMFFDEIQYLRDWEKYIKAIVDRYPTIKCIVSGSAAAALRMKSNESGAGRFTDFLLPPLNFYEYLFLLDMLELLDKQEEERGPKKRHRRFFSTENIEELNNEFTKYVNFGGYPEVIFSEAIQADPARFIKSDIIDKVLLRDLPSLYGIRDIQELNYLFTTLAFNTANEVSLDGLSKGSEIAKNTIKRYIEYLEAAFLIKVIHRVDRNAKRFKRANFFKVYLTNPSMRAALFSPINSDDKAFGDLAETAVFAQWFHSDLHLHYARWGGGEVDFVNVLAEQKVSWTVEVKWTDRYFDKPAELRSLIAFCHRHNLDRAMVTSINKTGVKSCESVELEFTPASVYCFTLGYNILKGKLNQGLREGIEVE